MTKFQIGSGKSDSFFFYTANSQFIIKTLKEAELKLLVRKGVLSKYHNHLEHNPDSMLARFYGIYNVKIKYMKPISVVIMDNLMSENVNEILRVYDLKGSQHKRITKTPKNNRSVRKDLNFLQDKDSVLRLSFEEQQHFKERMYKDKEFLKSCQLMDYSLLLIFFKKSQWAEDEEEMQRLGTVARSNQYPLRQREDGGSYGRGRETALIRNDDDVILEVDEGDGTEI